MQAAREKPMNRSNRHERKDRAHLVREAERNMTTSHGHSGATKVPHTKDSTAMRRSLTATVREFVEAKETHSKGGNP